KELIEILTTSLEEKVDDLIELGSSREDAIEKTIKEFGDTSDVLDAFPESKNRSMSVVKKRRNQLIFATLAYLIVTGLATYVNLEWLITSTNWFVFVAIGLLFWPLVMLYQYLGARK
ncbi:MAG: hypothetical protein KAH13_00465, partial [Tenericutes bacterium]|nr:hypothetical protein [Mycoplasmatota bacterium]